MLHLSPVSAINRMLNILILCIQAVIDVPHKWTINSAPNSSSLVTDRGSNPTPPHPPPFVRYILNELQITTGETLYGLGEQFGPFVKNGQVSPPNNISSTLILTSRSNRAFLLGRFSMESRRWHFLRASLQKRSLLHLLPWLRRFHQPFGRRRARSGS